MQENWYIDTPEKLHKLCHVLSEADTIAVDTEFMRERTYFAQLCLIQVATDDLVACIDPLALAEFDCLLDILYDIGKLKLFHAARQDLEIFYDLKGTLPGPVFDTQIAATLLGYSDQIGYANLAEDLLEAKIDKSHARTDWSQRPLSPQQLRYAADDVRYLLQLYPIIKANLSEAGRLDWLDEDFATLTNTKLYANPPDKAWKRVGAHSRLNGPQLAILQELAAWREQRAQSLNKPRKWILNDDVLISLAKNKPSTQQQLEKTRGITTAVCGHSGTDIIELIHKALKIPKQEWPIVKQRIRLTTEQEVLTDTLMAYLRLLAAEQKISPTALASRKDLEKLARDDRDIALLQGWKAHIAGDKLLDYINGKISLRVVNGKVITSGV